MNKEVITEIKEFIESLVAGIKVEVLVVKKALKVSHQINLNYNNFLSNHLKNPLKN